MSITLSMNVVIYPYLTIQSYTLSNLLLSYVCHQTIFPLFFHLKSDTCASASWCTIVVHRLAFKGSGHFFSAHPSLWWQALHAFLINRHKSPATSLDLPVNWWPSDQVSSPAVLSQTVIYLHNAVIIYSNRQQIWPTGNEQCSRR